MEILIVGIGATIIGTGPSVVVYPRLRRQARAAKKAKMHRMAAVMGGRSLGLQSEGDGVL